MNLWDEFDNQHPAQAAVSNRRVIRLTDHTILSSLRTWLLSDYAPSYCRTLASLSIYRRCYWIDAWSGGRGYGVQAKTPADNNAEQPAKGGSMEDAPGPLPPLLQPIVALSQALAMDRKPIALNALIVEVGGKHKATKAQGDSQSGNNGASSVPKALTFAPSASGISKASWAEIAPTLLQTIEQSPAIFLLNPFGQTLLTHEQLSPLCQRTTAPTELLLLIAHTQAIAQLRACSRTLNASAAFTALLRSDRWKALLAEDGEEIPIAIDDLLSLLSAAIQPHFLTVQRIDLPMQVRPPLLEPVPYTLLFATRSKDSVLSMNDAVYHYHQRLQEQSRGRSYAYPRGILAAEWFTAKQHERDAQEKQDLYQRTLTQGRTQRAQRWPELRQHLLLASFGQFPRQTYDEIIRTLLASGEVQCIWRRKATEEEESQGRVPANDDTLLWHSARPNKKERRY